MSLRIFSLIVVICATSCVRQTGRVSVRASHTGATVIRSVSSGVSNSEPLTTTGAETNSNVMTGVQIFERYNSAVFMVFTSDGRNSYQGSGFFINSHGLAVSNYHVFKGTSIGREIIKLYNGDRYQLKRVIAKNAEDDIIIFEVDAPNKMFNYIPVATQYPKVGERAFAIGSPHGLENTFSSGEISQIREKGYIQISVPIDHGSSGGALINTKGQVIGITSGGFEVSGANLNYAKDIQLLRKYIDIN